MNRTVSVIHRASRRVLVVCVLAAVSAAPGRAVAADEPYRKPSDDIVAILTAPPLPSVDVDPTRRVMLLLERRGMPAIDDLAQPMLQLAGQRINPRTNGRHGAPRGGELVGITIKSIETGREHTVDVPDGARISSPRWAPDGSRFAFTITEPDRIRLLVCDAESGGLTAVAGAVNAIGGGYRWMPDARRLLVHFVPKDRGAAPERSAVPTGPIVQEASGRVSPVRTYQDLLRDPHDEALFEHYFTSQLALVDITTGGRTLIGPPAIYRGADPSPAGLDILVSRIVRPYSYQVPMWSFAHVTEVIDPETGSVTEVARAPIADRTPIGGVPTGPRNIGWQDVIDARRLVWAEALDEGDPNKEVPHRDRLMLLEAPFDGAAREVHRTEHRFQGVSFIERSSFALVNEYDRDTRWTRTWLISPKAARHEPKLVFDRSSQDRYGDPGRPVTITNPDGRSVVAVDAGWIWLSGRGASPDGDRPFLDRMNMETLETERVWQCGDDALESMVALLGPEGDRGRRLMVRHETKDEPPNYFVHEVASGERTALTEFEHPAPQLRDVHKELVRYTRDDGVELSATLYLPPGYDPDDPERERLPLLVWAYPLEYNDAYTAGQVRGSPHRFTSIGGSSHLFLLLEGYAIMDAATMPVVGADPETVNDTFIEQIVASAQAAIDYADERGVADPERVGVGGHSYGAFMTANLLAHCDLFRAGVARSGAYNRTLTPFGFQSERRTFWEAPDAYFALSPFMHADEIDEPLLLIHGRKDNNSGTFPIQSERLYHAVKGHGGTVRLVMLPEESHGYRAEESIMHVLWEMTQWFERWVKSGGP